jgi:hypothetical protein
MVVKKRILEVKKKFMLSRGRMVLTRRDRCGCIRSSPAEWIRGPRPMSFDRQAFSGRSVSGPPDPIHWQLSPA